MGCMDAAHRPRLRGVFHYYAFFAAIGAGLMLVTFADGMRARFSACLYGAALAAMFGASALYHRYPWKSARRRLWARRLDHSTIFIFIAGTYTPFALLVFTGPLRWVVLACVWGGAALGLLLNFVWLDAPKWLAAVAYTAVGWVGLAAVPQLLDAVGIPLFLLVALGGLLYTIGAVVYACHWPNPFPATLGFHEVFHLLVVAAAAAQFVAVSSVIV
jgi:hemolysin III